MDATLGSYDKTYAIFATGTLEVVERSFGSVKVSLVGIRGERGRVRVAPVADRRPAGGAGGL